MAIFLELAKPWYLAWVTAYVTATTDETTFMKGIGPVGGIPNIPGC